MHAPQLLVSQPMCVPVSAERLVRMKSTSSTRGSTSCVCSVPLTVTVISTLSLLMLVRPAACSRGRGERAAGEDAHDVALPLGRAAHVVARLATPPRRARRPRRTARRSARWPTSTASAAVDLRVDRRDRREREPGVRRSCRRRPARGGRRRRRWRSRRSCARASGTSRPTRPGGTGMRTSVTISSSASALVKKSTTKSRDRDRPLARRARGRRRRRRWRAAPSSSRPRDRSARPNRTACRGCGPAGRRSTARPTAMAPNGEVGARRRRRGGRARRRGGARSPARARRARGSG